MGQGLARPIGKCFDFAYAQRMTNKLPADPETERLARHIAEATGRSLPTVVKEAIAAKAEAEGIEATGADRRRKKLDFAKLRAIIDRSATRPIQDKRPPDAIIGYNDIGAPE
jgi:antitoxin VapB